MENESKKSKKISAIRNDNEKKKSYSYLKGFNVHGKDNY